ncbi:MAG: hypothetical protein A3D65_01730 [Candidatus Lloydbacteria bacterium RIFCSPHIGHO2_02_FULL_50_13]|uniref:Uncharacterized protein n=1 Tax=Candidatus Lloydbacteria bacterium RIFCSPHIGHO2_02_FULL_50_13 TaxID=1798661 RepID=A0A1G2DAS6_9BACT|nr:MAG: hypothetical protein A3D65_01730 [Candidatus Lloydbacteria bacterium RIFCSPHIGHO2_02_FULL_50_13]
MLLIVFLGFVAFLFGLVITLGRIVAPDQFAQERMLAGGIAHAVVVAYALLVIGIGAEGRVDFFVGLAVVELVLAIAFLIGYGVDMKKPQTPNSVARN